MDAKNVIQNTLNRTSLDKIKPSQSIVDMALSFDVKDLDTIPDTDLTKMIVGVSQYIIYITLEINKFKVQKVILDRNIEVGVALFVASTKLSKGTKSEKRMLAVGASDELTNKDEQLNNILVELSLLENIDKYLEFYCNALKKELSRRERELTFKPRQ
jgi:hypothetical protein